MDLSDSRINLKIFDPVLQVHMSLKTLRILRLCPVDIFFTSQSTGLHGKTLKSLATKGYLNEDYAKDGLIIEYYLNNHGHRLRRLNVGDTDLLRDFEQR